MKPAAQASTGILSVFMDDRLVGTLHNDEPLSFSYEGGWLSDPAAVPLDPAIPLQAGKLDSPYVHALFENLLPEGDQRKLISLRHHVSSIFGLLATVGGDTAGSIVLLPAGQVPQPPTYRMLDWDQIGKMIHAGGNDADDDDAGDEPDEALKPRLSISGAQLKMLISLDEHGNPLRPMGTSPSTHILKPDMVRPDIKLFASAVNETIVMRAARLCELPAAAVSYQPQVKVCLVQRLEAVMHLGVGLGAVRTGQMQGAATRQ